MKPKLSLIVTKPCDRYHMTTCERNVQNAAKALIRVRRRWLSSKVDSKQESRAASLTDIWEYRLDCAVKALEDEEKRSRGAASSKAKR